MLRQEVYALRRHRQGAGTPTPSPSRTSPSARCSRAAPTATPSSSPTPREAISYHYERNPDDPRDRSHALTLEVDDYGNVLQVSRRRLRPPPRRDRDSLPTGRGPRRADQRTLHHLHREPRHQRDRCRADDDYRTPLPGETRTFELTGYAPTGPAAGSRPRTSSSPIPAPPAACATCSTTRSPTRPRRPSGRQRRLIEQHPHALPQRRPDRPAAARASCESLALPGESYKLAFTPGLLAQVFQRPRDGQPPKPCCPIRRPCSAAGRRPGRLPAEPGAQGRRPLPRERRRRPLVDPVRAVVLHRRPRRHRGHRAGARPAALLPAAPLPRPVRPRRRSSTSTPTTC